MNTLTNWNPVRDLEEMQNRLLRSLGLGLNRRIPEGQQSITTAEWAPSVDISEDDHEYLIKAELPEVNKDEVKVTVENGVVSIKGERKFEKEDNNRKYHRIERSCIQGRVVAGPQVTTGYNRWKIRFELSGMDLRWPRLSLAEVGYSHGRPSHLQGIR